jgi:hypothetical protein
MCDEKWTGTQAEFLAMDRVRQTEAAVLAFADRPFVGTVTSYMDDTGGVTERVFSAKGVTRFSTRRSDGPTTVTYVTKKRVCARKVSKAQPNTFAADERARWACRARTAKDRDGRSWIASLTPTSVLADHPAPEWLADVTRPSTDGSADSSLIVLLHDNSPNYQYDWVILPTKMLLDLNAFDSVTWLGDATIVTTQDVPRLPVIPALKP